MENKDWFSGAKLGIFLHWGIYSTKGVDASWPMWHKTMTRDEYLAMAKNFDPVAYDPVKWAKLFKKIGARYTVLTSKHHDGVALFDTKAEDGLSVKKLCPNGRDLIAPYAEAMRNEGLAVGLYYSHLDWNNPAYAAISENGGEQFIHTVEDHYAPGDPEYETLYGKFHAFHRTQLKELLTNYGQIDLLWFDGVWEHSEEWWRFRETADFLRRLSPNTLLNQRIGQYGDYKCAENGVPTCPAAGPWELCYTLNDNWAYVPTDHNFKDLRELVFTFVDCISAGGNLLLGIGPCPDGTISAEYERRLGEFGDWIRPHAEAIFDTQRGPGPAFFAGGSTLSADGRDLYLFLLDKPRGEVPVKGMEATPASVTVLGGSKKELKTRKTRGFDKVPGVFWFTVPDEETDKTCTVVKLHFDEPVTFYRGEGGGL